MSHFAQTRPLPSLMTLALASTLSVGTLAAQEIYRHEISRTHEKEISVRIELSFGTLILSRGPGDLVLKAEQHKAREDEEDLYIRYKLRGDVGDLTVRSHEDTEFWGESSGEDGDERKWILQITDAIPVKLHIELGAGEGKLDVSGLQIRELKVESGASAVKLTCDEPNRIGAESIVIESGVSKFTAENLCNTNFRSLKFSGGVGAYRLDFGGNLRSSADAKIEVGLGAITIDVPWRTQVRLVYDDDWFSSFDLDDGFTKRKNGIYETEGFDRHEDALSIEVESGLGSVKVRRRNKD